MNVMFPMYIYKYIIIVIIYPFQPAGPYIHVLKAAKYVNIAYQYDTLLVQSYRNIYLLKTNKFDMHLYAWKDKHHSFLVNNLAIVFQHQRTRLAFVCLH